MTITTKEKILEKVFQKNPDFHFRPLAGQLIFEIFEKAKFYEIRLQSKKIHVVKPLVVSTYFSKKQRFT